MARRPVLCILSVCVLAGLFMSAPPGSLAPARASASAARVPLYDQWTSTTQVFQNTDGTFSATIGAGPIQVADPSSANGWTPVDTTLSPAADGFSPDSVEPEVTFSSGDGSDTSDLATLAQDGASITLGLDAGTIPAPTVEGDTATYPDVQPGVDATLRATATGFEESFVVDSAAHAPTTLDVPVNAQGLTPSLTDGGALLLTDASGAVVGWADPAMIWGAATDPVTGEPSVIDTVPTRLVADGDGSYTLELTPDPSFWDDPDLRYPVTLDPSTSLSVVTDTYVRSDLPTNSYGSSTDLRAGYDGSSTARTLLQFNTSAIAYRTIDSATLNLYENYANSCTTTEIDVYEATDAWSGTTTWNSQPSLGPKYASTSASHGHSGCSADWVAFSTGGDGGLTFDDLAQS